MMGKDEVGKRIAQVNHERDLARSFGKKWLSSWVHLLISQRLDRVHACRLARRNESEEDSYGEGKRARQQD